MTKPSREMLNIDAIEILKNAKYGVLSTATLDGIPYGIPLNYFYVEEDNAIYFHCFIKGRKLDNIKENNKVSFVVVGKENIVPNRFITHYESVIVTGSASFIASDEEKTKRLIQLCDILTPAVLERREEIIKKHLPAVMIVKIDIEEISGKRNQDL